MSEFSFGQPLLCADTRRNVAGWLTLGLVSLVAAGVFSILLVLARTPYVQELIPFLDFFRVALVVHVTLSVVIWLLAISAASWSLSASGRKPLWDRLSLYLAVLGTAIIIVSPFAGAARPLMNNYVPILQHPMFYTGFVLFAVGIFSHLVYTIIYWPKIRSGLNGTGALLSGISISALITGLAMLSIVFSWLSLPSAMDGQIYFEFLFWGGGHVLQFSYTLLMMIAWVVLAANSGCQFELTPRLTLVFLVILALPVITVPFLYLAHAATSAGHRLAFTELMKYGGLSCIPLGLAVVTSLWRAQRPQGEQRYLRAALHSSIALFAVGGVLGFLIAGLDIVIPAHYHGSTVGVTIAFMGFTYYLLPRVGFSALPERLATMQPYIYGGGQLMHIAGLAWSGGYGVQRKTAGVAQGLDGFAQTAGMGLMGLGGMISIIGGVMFLIVAYKSMRSGRTV